MIFPDPLRDLCDRFGIILIDGTNSVSVLPPIGNVLERPVFRMLDPNAFASVRPLLRRSLS